MADSPLCECREMQTIKHILLRRVLIGTMFEEGLANLHEDGPPTK